jgi:Carboxypeptidase regulatory-like domain
MVLRTVLYLAMAVSWQQQGPPAGAAPQDSQQGGFRISGTVVDAMSGAVLAHALVSINAQGVRDSSRSMETGGDGRFVFENLPAGRYGLLAKRRGYLQQFYKQHEQFSTAIVVGPELSTENLRFEMRPQASLSGQILDEMNEPVRNAQVMLFRRALALGRRQTWQQSSVQTDDLGRFHVGNLDPGTYFVAVSAQPWYAQRVMHNGLNRTDTVGESSISGGYSTAAAQSFGRTNPEEVTTGEPEFDVVYPVTFFPNAADIGSAAHITLRAGDAETADIRLQPVPALHVLLRTTSTPAPGESEAEGTYASATITVAGIQLGVPMSSQQVAPGVIEISGLPPGRFNLRLNTNKNGEMTSRMQNVQISGDTEVTLSEVDSSGTVNGIAKLENGAALNPSPTIILRARGGGEQFTAQADANGEFNLKEQAVPPGVYDVLIQTAQPPVPAVKSMSTTGAKFNGRSVEIAGGQDVRMKLVLSQGTGRVSGFAEKDGKRVDGVMIVLVPEVAEHNLVLFRRDQTDSDGSFLLQGVHPGKYTVIAIEDGWELEWLTSGLLQKYLAGGEALEVTPNARIEVKVKVQQP